MEYIGEYIAPSFDGYHWHGDYYRCPPDDNITCKNYVSENTKTWDCKHCDGDICRSDKAGWLPTPPHRGENSRPEMAG